MKKRIITVILTIAMIVGFILPINAAVSKDDRCSLVVSDDIKAQIWVKETDTSVYKIYNTSIHVGFCNAKNIDDVFNTDRIHGPIYVVEQSNGIKRFYYEEDGEMIEMPPTETLVDGEVVMGHEIYLRDEIMNAFKTREVIENISKDIVVENIYYLYGGYTHTGHGVYYATDKGDYVFYFYPDIGFKLFPVADFCEYQKALVDELYTSDGKDGGFSSVNWDLSKYDYNSESFAFNLDNPPKAEGNNAPGGALVSDSGSEGTNMKIYLFVCAGVSIALASTAVVLTVLKKRRSKTVS